MDPEGVISSVVAAGSGPDLVLLHGGPGLSDYMAVVEPEVSAWRHVRYQQRGIRPSTTSGPFTVEQHLEDVASVLDATASDRVVLLGHSWGGHLALQAAIAMPERVLGAVVVDPLGSTGDGGASVMAAALAERLLPANAERAAELVSRLAEDESSDDDALELLCLQWPGYFATPAEAPPPPPGLRLSRACNGEAMASAFADVADGFAQRLMMVRVPVELVLGEHSPIPVSVGIETAGLLPNGRATVVPASGHLPWHERPGCLRDALDRLSARLD